MLLSLNNFEFSLLVLATVCLAAAGNTINDIYDVETDLVNKPYKVIIGRKISEKNALIIYVTLNFIAVGIGFYLSHLIGKPQFAVIFVLISGLLYLYASTLKGTVILGNLLISFLTSMVFIIVGVYDLLPNLYFFNLENRLVFEIIFHFSVFSFFINLLREMVKDQEDLNGDYKAGMNTLPIVLGRKRANKVIFGVALLPIIGLVYYIYNYLYHFTYAVLFIMFFLLGPLLYFVIKIWETKSKREFKHLSLLLKLLMLIGILSIALYPVS